MARSYGVLKISVWEPGSEFRTLSPLAQWAYTMLISQPQISNLGVLPYTPEKWARLAAGLDREQIHDALDELERERYTITDVDTGELLVRTFIKHDAVWKQPKLVTNARKLIREVESDSIRGYLIDRHPWLVEDWSKAEIEQYETPSDTPIERGSDTPIAKGVPEGVSAPRARAGPGQGPGPGSSSRTPTDEALDVDDARAQNGRAEGPAAAATWDEAARETDIRQAVEQLRGHDSRSFGRILPIARDLPAPLFHDVVQRTNDRIQTGDVRNPVGLLVELLRVARDEQARRIAAEHAATAEQATPFDEIAFHAASYARGKHPWPVIKPLLELKISRLADDPDERVELLQAAVHAYEDERDPPPPVSTTAATGPTIDA